MNIDQRKALMFLMYMPLIPLTGGATLWAAEKLAILVQWGQFGIPDTATYDQLMSALVLELAIFLGILGIARGILYFKGVAKKRWTFLVYWGLPFILAFFLSDTLLHIAWMVIAGVAWFEVFLVFFAPDTAPAQKTKRGR